MQDLNVAQGVVGGLSGTVSSADASDILRLIGINAKGAASGEGQLALTVSGNEAQGYRTAIDVQGLGATAGFAGTYHPQFAKLGFDGAFALNAEHSDAVLAALGFPLATAGNGKLALKVHTVPTAESLILKNVALQLGDESVKGAGKLAGDGALNLDVSGGNLRLIDAVAAAASPWIGAGSFPNGSFESGWPFGLSGEIWLRPQSLSDFFGQSVSEPVIGLSSDGKGRGLSVIGRYPSSAQLKLDASLKQKGNGFALAGFIHYPLPLAQIFAGGGKEFGPRGGALLDSTFAGEGRSPLALLNTISGTGTLDVGAGQLLGLAPEPFFVAIKEAKSNDEIQKAFTDLTSGPGMATQPMKFAFDAKDGALAFKTVDIETEQLTLSLQPSVDLTNATVSTAVTLSSKLQPDLPEMRVIYEGVPAQMHTRLDAAALASKLGTALINRDMAELDRIAQEQKKAAADAAVQAQADKDKFDAFQAQRMELRLQQRMVKVFAQQRSFDAARAKAALDAAVNYGLSIVKDEKRRLMQLLPAK